MTSIAAQGPPALRNASEPPSLAGLTVSCRPPGRKTPAVPVPECVDAQGFATSCSAVGAVRLHPPSRFRPASPIPPERDSTDRVAGKSVPGRASGHELFSSVDIVESGGAARLYVAYNAGIQVWDISQDPARPRIRASRDGWSGDFLVFPPVSEVLNYIEDVSAVAATPGTDLVAAAGIIPAGVTLWRYDHVTRRLRQLYQDPGLSARQVRFVELGGRHYVVAGADNGLAVYDADAAFALSEPCLDGDDHACGVFVAFVRGETSRYIDAVVAGDTILLSAASGVFSSLTLIAWRPTPAPRAEVRWTGEVRNAAGNALFEYGGSLFVAVVEESRGLNRERVQIFDVTRCKSGPCNSRNGTVRESAVPVDVSGFSTANDFLTLSWLDGRPMLYYGLATGNLFGPQLERLFDLRQLSVRRQLASWPEIAAGGGTYTDPCNGSPIGYFAHYYSANAQGLNNFVPRIGKFSSKGYFYRAAATVLDVHVWERPPAHIFSDGFESRDTRKWRVTVP